MKRRVRVRHTGDEDFTLFVGHRPLKWTLCLWPVIAGLIAFALTLQPSRFLTSIVLGVLAVVTSFWLREHFGSDSLTIRDGEISVSRGFGVLKSTKNFRLSDIEAVAFYPASRNPQRDPESCIGISARQWVPPLGLAFGIGEEEALDILRQMKSVVLLSPKIQMERLSDGLGRGSRI